MVSNPPDDSTNVHTSTPSSESPTLKIFSNPSRQTPARVMSWLVRNPQRGWTTPSWIIFLLCFFGFWFLVGKISKYTIIISSIKWKQQSNQSSKIKKYSPNLMRLSLSCAITKRITGFFPDSKIVLFHDIHQDRQKIG